jgi:hypothetical protein
VLGSGELVADPLSPRWVSRINHTPGGARLYWTDHCGLGPTGVKRGDHVEAGGRTYRVVPV